MLHVATVHWKSDRWIEVQRRYLDRFSGSPYRVYAFVNGVDQDYSGLFYFYCTEDIECCAGGYNHGAKLNILADVIASHAADDDILVFLDGDAFPIANLSNFIETNLESAPLLAVRRDENMADVQPHPCFAAARVGFWKEIRGDWKPGYRWKNANGDLVTDTGGNLLGRITEIGTEWYPVLRTNKKNIHPIWFGIYGDVVYHHGAGFRGKVARPELAELNRRFRWRALIKRLCNSPSWTKKNLGHLLDSLYDDSRYNAELEALRARNAKLMNNVFARLVEDEEFWKMFV